MVLAALALLALTRAELIDRFRADPVTQVEGLVQVWGDCPKEMRRKYQLPVASCASDVCRTLYAARMGKTVRFKTPRIVIHIGDATNGVTNVIARVMTRDTGERYTKIFIPAPDSADVVAFRTEVAKAFFLAVDDKVVDDDAVRQELRRADPDLRIADSYEALRAWRAGEKGAEGDDEFLKLQRKVLVPGHATRDDVLSFAARLRLYPDAMDLPFAGRYESCSFDEAIALARLDPLVRLAALNKAKTIPVLGGGHGEKFDAAAKAYQVFLLELAIGKRDDLELATLLSDAETKLKGAIE